MTAIEIINQIEADKKARSIEPHHATLREIEVMACINQQELALCIVRAELVELWKEKKIQIGDTINSKYITVL